MTLVKRFLVVAALAASGTSTFTTATFTGRSTPTAFVGRKAFVVPTSSGVSSPNALALSTRGGAKAKKEESNELRERAQRKPFQTASYFTLWYVFNIAYNIFNNKALHFLDYPWTIATIQMATGIAYFVPMWLLGLRKVPKLTASEVKSLVPIALFNTGVHVGAVIAFGAGAVSFAHIVKASEPLVTCVLGAIFLGQILPLPVYASLLPIVGGVVLSSMRELSFTYLALVSAMLSTVSSSARGVLSKKTMSRKKIGENLDAQNLYAVLTVMSTAMLVPMMLFMEGTSMFKACNGLVTAGAFTRKGLTAVLALGGFSYYAYNEIAFLTLSKVNPATHAIGNTIKRPVIIIASVIAFNAPMSNGSIIGSTIAIAGTILYSLAVNDSKKNK